MKYINLKGKEVELKDSRETGVVMSVWPCYGCMPSYRRRFGYRICGHTEDTSKIAPLFKLN